MVGKTDNAKGNDIYKNRKGKRELKWKGVRGSGQRASLKTIEFLLGSLISSLPRPALSPTRSIKPQAFNPFTLTPN